MQSWPIPKDVVGGRKCSMHSGIGEQWALSIRKHVWIGQILAPHIEPAGTLFRIQDLPFNGECALREKEMDRELSEETALF